MLLQGLTFNWQIYKMCLFTVLILKRFPELRSNAIRASRRPMPCSLPALKNALGWASRAPENRLLAGKPTAIMGSGGGMGTARAQYHLRQVCVFLELYPLNKPEIFSNALKGSFDDTGNQTKVFSEAFSNLNYFWLDHPCSSHVADSSHRAYIPFPWLKDSFLREGLSRSIFLEENHLQAPGLPGYYTFLSY